MKFCRKCGLRLGFRKIWVRKIQKWCPTNPDGSDHWDLCRATWIANMTPAERAEQAERDRAMAAPRRRPLGRAVTHLWVGELPPWDESLGAFRDFTAAEKADPGICVPV